MQNFYTITEEMFNQKYTIFPNSCSTNKIIIVGTLDVIIDTVDTFLMIHPQATLKDFITFLEKTRTNYIRESGNNES